MHRVELRQVWARKVSKPVLLLDFIYWDVLLHRYNFRNHVISLKKKNHEKTFFEIFSQKLKFFVFLLNFLCHLPPVIYMVHAWSGYEKPSKMSKEIIFELVVPLEVTLWKPRHWCKRGFSCFFQKKKGMKFLWFTSSPTSAKTYDVVKNGLEPAEGIQNTTFCDYKKISDSFVFFSGVAQKFQKSGCCRFWAQKKGFGSWLSQKLRFSKGESN